MPIQVTVDTNLDILNKLTFWENKSYVKSGNILFLHARENNRKIFTLYREMYSECCYSLAKPCLALCDPEDYSTPGFPVLHYHPEFPLTHVH